MASVRRQKLLRKPKRQVHETEQARETIETETNIILRTYCHQQHLQQGRVSTASTILMQNTGGTHPIDESVAGKCIKNLWKLAFYTKKQTFEFTQDCDVGYKKLSVPFSEKFCNNVIVTEYNARRHAWMQHRDHLVWRTPRRKHGWLTNKAGVCCGVFFANAA